MGKSAYDRIIRRLERLPALSEVIDKILDQAKDPDASAHDLAVLIGMDEGLSSRLLRLVNSPFYGLAGKVSSVQAAVTLLGLRTVRSLALSVSVFQSFKWADPEESNRFLRFWQHSLATATAAGRIAALKAWKSPEEAFTAGLMHDLGKLIMLQKDPEPFEAACEEARRRGVDLPAVEEERFGIDHPRLGHMVAEKWKFPEGLRDAIRLHHDAATAARNGGGENLALCIVVANAAAKLSLMGESGNDHRFAVPMEAVDALGLTRGSISDLCVHVAQQSIHAFRTFGLRTEVRAQLLIPLEADEPFARTCLRVAVLDADEARWQPAIMTLRGFGHLVEVWKEPPTDLDDDLQPHVVVTPDLTAIPMLVKMRGAQFPGIVALVPQKLTREERNTLESAGVVSVPQSHGLIDLVDGILKCFLDASTAVN